MHRLRVALYALLMLTAGQALAGNWTPDPASVQRWGPAYRYPHSGWVHVHIEGDPHSRGEQHGRLLATEIAAYIQALAYFTDSAEPMKAWAKARHLAETLFIKGFTEEQIAEMQGIADGAQAAGARFNHRPLDLVDIVTLNLANELHSFDSALDATPTAAKLFPDLSLPLTAKNGPALAYLGPVRCSAFAATGPATRDGQLVFGHLTMFSIYPANYYNIWLDVVPTRGHRFVMQTSPGNIHSGMDYAINDAGLVLSETSIEQTGFNPKGIPQASRIRQAQQYAGTIEQAAQILQENSNGLSSTEWLLADVHRNEIALLTLGTATSKLYRSSQKEWIAGAEGFYWSNNNNKDQAIRLETVAGPDARPSLAGVPLVTQRDAIWLRMYDQYRGRIDSQFAHQLFSNPNIVLSMSVDAKFTTGALARQLATWATYGPPLGAVRYPDEDEQQSYPGIEPLVSNPWVILGTKAPGPARVTEPAVDLPDPAGPNLLPVTHDAALPDTQPAWHGTLLPASDADIWLVSAFANYERIVALGKALDAEPAKPDQPVRSGADLMEVKLAYYRSQYELAARAGRDFPLRKTKATYHDEKWYDIASSKGVLLLHQLRRQLGAEQFDRLMDEFGLAHSLKPTSSQAFQAFLEQKTGQDLEGFFQAWLDNLGYPPSHAHRTQGETGYVDSPFTVYSFDSELADSLIVYGTQDDTTANREAAQQLQQLLYQRRGNQTAALRSDSTITEQEIRTHHLILIGRPDANRLLARFKHAFPVTFGPSSFRARGQTYAHPQSAILIAGVNPLNDRYSLVAVSGLSALATLKTSLAFARGIPLNAPAIILPHQQASIAYVP